MDIKCTGTYNRSWERMGKTNNVRESLSRTSDKLTNESLGQIFIIKVESMNQIHLLSDVVVAPVLFFFVTAAEDIVFRKNIITKFLTKTKNKNINEICTNLYDT